MIEDNEKMSNNTISQDFSPSIEGESRRTDGSIKKDPTETKAPDHMTHNSDISVNSTSASHEIAADTGSRYDE